MLRQLLKVCAVTAAMSACGNIKPPELEPVDFPLQVVEGDELFMSCSKLDQKAILPLDIPKDVKVVDRIDYLVNQEWACFIMKKKRQ